MDARESILSALDRVARPATLSRAPLYRPAGTLDHKARTELFTERVTEYGAEVHHVTAGNLSTIVNGLIARGGVRSLALPAALPASWSAELHSCNLLEEQETADAELAEVDAVLTGSTGAIAVSGSILLQHGPAQGRRALTLLPDHHFCVVAVESIVETLPEALAVLQPTRPTTIISGPSATADIEMTRIQGVHGPRQLTVLLLSDAASV